VSNFIGTSDRLNTISPLSLKQNMFSLKNYEFLTCLCRILV